MRNLKTINRLLLLLIMALLALPAVLLAGDAAGPSGLVAMVVRDVLLPLAGTVLLGVLSSAAALFRRKTGIEVKDQIIEQAVRSAEAAGNDYFMRHGCKLPGDESQNLAVTYALEHGGKLFKNKALPQLRKAVDAKVQAVFNQGRDYSEQVAQKEQAGAYCLKDASQLLRGAMRGRPEPEHIDEPGQPGDEA